MCEARSDGSVIAASHFQRIGSNRVEDAHPGLPSQGEVAVVERSLEVGFDWRWATGSLEKEPVV